MDAPSDSRCRRRFQAKKTCFDTFDKWGATNLYLVCSACRRSCRLAPCCRAAEPDALEASSVAVIANMLQADEEIERPAAVRGFPPSVVLMRQNHLTPGEAGETIVVISPAVYIFRFAIGGHIAAGFGSQAAHTAGRSFDGPRLARRFLAARELVLTILHVSTVWCRSRPPRSHCARGETDGLHLPNSRFRGPYRPVRLFSPPAGGLGSSAAARTWGR